MTRVLLTGASGFVGRHTLAPLLDAGLEVHAVSSHGPLADAPAAVRWHRGDLLVPGTAAELVERIEPTHLLHLAWYAEPGVFWAARANLDWARASLELLRAFGERGGRRAVIAGTCAEYQWAARTHCTECITPTLPATLYGLAKHGVHVVADALARQLEVELAWGRVFLLYGPHEQPRRLASEVASAVVRGRAVNCSHGRQVRDFLYVADLADAFVALLASEVCGPVNMASGEPVSVAELIGALAEAAGRPELVRLGARPAAAGEPERLTADVRRLRDEVGWRPTVSLREGAARTVSWWREAARTAALELA
jgi:nucleoside-diphosphate-sugar epimerase